MAVVKGAGCCVLVVFVGYEGGSEGSGLGWLLFGVWRSGALSCVQRGVGIGEVV